MQIVVSVFGILIMIGVGVADLVVQEQSKAANRGSRPKPADADLAGGEA